MLVEVLIAKARASRTPESLESSSAVPRRWLKVSAVAQKGLCADCVQVEFERHDGGAVVPEKSWISNNTVIWFVFLYDFHVAIKDIN